MNKDINIGDCQLMFGDCLERMKEIEDHSIDMVLCDLPYGTTACKWDSVIPFEPLWAQYNRILKEDGSIVLFSAQPFTSVMVNSNIKNYRHHWIWLEYLIRTYSNENDLILDNTCGSGSTGVACINTNRKFIGIELDEKYYDISCKRIEEAINEKKQQLF
jgi:DNA modification methylase